MNLDALCQSLHDAVGLLPQGYQLELRVSRESITVGILDRVERYFVADDIVNLDIPSQINSLINDAVARETPR